ncbi:hypothetical protein GCM10009689_22250 [Brevibacterium antiquum]
MREPVRGSRKDPAEGGLGGTRRWNRINGQHHLGEQCRFLRPETGELLGRDTCEALRPTQTRGDIGQEQRGPQSAAMPITMTPGTHESILY